MMLGRLTWLLSVRVILPLLLLVGPAPFPATVAQSAQVKGKPLLYTYPRDQYPDIGPVNDILQTRDGTLWFAGRRGILEYDGFRWHRHDTEDGLNATYIYRLHEGEDGTLYACTWRGLHTYDPIHGRWNVYPVKQNEPVRDLDFIPGGFVVAADDGIGLIRDRGHYRIPMTDRWPAAAHNGPVHEVRYEAERGYIWASSEMHGLIRLDLDKAWEYFVWKDSTMGREYDRLGLESFIDTYGYSPEAEENFVRGDSAQAKAMRDAMRKHYIPSDSERMIRTLAWPGQDKAIGDPLVATLKSVYQVQRDHLVEATDLVNLVGHHPHLLKGTSGGLLVAGRRGAWSLSDKDTLFYESEHDAGSDLVSGMVKDRDGILWMGNEGGWIRKHVHPAVSQIPIGQFDGLTKLHHGRNESEESLLLVAAHRVVRLANGRWNSIFEATESTGQVVDVSTGPKESILIATTRQLFVLQDGRTRSLLSFESANTIRNPFFTTGTGVWYIMDWQQHFWDGRTLQNHTILENFLSITEVENGRDGQLIMGSWAGLLTMKDSVLTRHSFHGRYTCDMREAGKPWLPVSLYESKPFPDESILTMDMDSDSMLWCGTLNGGILRFDGDSLMAVNPVAGTLQGSYNRSYRTEDGRIYFYGAVHPAVVEDGELRVLMDANPLESVIKRIGEDAAGRIYLTTTRGVLVLEDNELKLIIGAGLGAGFGSITGVHPLGESRMCMVMGDELILLDIERYINQESDPHKPVVWTVDTANGPMSPDEVITVPVSQRSVTFNFSLPFFLNEEMHNFSWWLEGLEQEYCAYQPEGEVSYDRLPPGDYTFHLRARDSIGRVSEIARPIAVSVPPRFYESSVFPLVLLLAVGGLIYLIIRLSVNASERRNRQLEERIDERTKELSAALDELEKRKDAEVDAARLRVAQRMAVTLSHEFNNPLAILKAVAQMLGMYKANKLPEDVASLIRRIPPVVDRLGDLTRKMHHIAEVRVTEYGHGVEMLDLKQERDPETGLEDRQPSTVTTGATPSSSTSRGTPPEPPASS